jgi:hypothetical protein
MVVPNGALACMAVACAIARLARNACTTTSQTAIPMMGSLYARSGARLAGKTARLWTDAIIKERGFRTILALRGSSARNWNMSCTA